MAYSDDILNAANETLPWEKLEGCNILVTGATGLIGECLVEILMARRNKAYNVYASGRNEERAQTRFGKFTQDNAFHFIKHDVQEPLNCNVDFHYVIHAASNASPNFFTKNPVEVMTANILGVNHLLKYGKEHQLKRMLYVSSGEIYGEGDGRIFEEDYSGYVDCTRPRSCYPSSKRAAETLCVSYTAEYGIETVIARPSHTYGPHFTTSDNRVYAQFIRNVINGENIVMKSTGSQFRSWCYVVDCAMAIFYILLKGESGQAYNIADKTSNITIKELAEMIAEIGGRNVIIDVPTDTEKAGYNVVSKSIFSTEKIEALGWTVRGEMKEKMQTTIQELHKR